MDAQRTAPVDVHSNAAVAEPDGSRRGAPQIVDDYELRGRLTRYPAADSFLAVHRPSGGERVLYVLRPAAMQDRPLVHRVACEVDAVRWVRHASVPTVDPCGETPQGRLYVAVERRPGQTLDEVVAEHGKLDVETLVRVAGRIVEALEQAHALGLVHAHLTPASVLLGPAETAGRCSPSLLGLGTSAATARPIAGDELAYASPELTSGGIADERSDVFAFASVLQFALRGVPPLPLLVRGAPRDGRAPTSVASAESVTGVIALARSADPSARYQTVKAFWDDLLAALVREAQELERRATPTSVPAPAWHTVGVETPLRVEPPASVVEIAPAAEGVFDAPAWEGACPPAVASPTRRVAWRWAAVGLTAVGLAGAAGLAGAGGRPSPATRTTEAAQGGLLGAERRAAPTESSAPHVAHPAAAVAGTKEPSVAAPAKSLANVPRLADISVPEIDLAPSRPVQREPVRAEEFAAMADASRARDGADTARPSVATPALINTAAARGEATRAVDAFASALAARDLAALHRAAPAMPASERARWAKVFREARSVAAQLTVLDVQVDGESITARVRSRIDVRMPGTSASTRFDAVSIATLVHDSTGWRLWNAP